MSDRLTVGLEKMMESVAEEVGEEVVRTTPVDTGFARANWRPSLNVAATSPVSFLDPTGEATISRIRVVARSFSVGDTIHLTNRAPYIEKLNEGSSPQAPAGFVAAAAQKGTDIAFGRIERGGLI